MSRDHTKLKVFHLADNLAYQVYEATQHFPPKEMFGLTAQMRRAAVSVPANIVEGCYRSSQGDYVRFLDIARGSLTELGYYLALSHRLGLLSEPHFTTLNDHFNACAKSLQALINSLGKPAKTQSP